MSFEILVQRSHEFHERIPFPTQANRIETVAPTTALQQEVVEHAANTRPLIHHRMIGLIEEFLKFKRKNGTSEEKLLYKNLDTVSFVDRLLKKRPVVFYCESDDYLLRDGKTMGAGGFDEIGTTKQKAPLILKDYLSYDEMLLSALIDVSVPTHFINNGAKDNRARQGEEGTFEKKGVIVAMVGARLEVPKMEWKHLVITPKQNCPENGYGAKGAAMASSLYKSLKLWANFYQQGDYFPTYQEAESDPSGRFLKIEKGLYFNCKVYKERIRMSVEPFLVDAHQRAQEKKAYVMAEGIGLGVWKLADMQAQLVLEVYADILKERRLENIADINFSRISSDSAPFYVYCKKIGLDPTQTFHFEKREPAEKIRKKDRLFITSYPWDGNSYPGNEYWVKGLASSSDPAAACCSTIAELQNPEINEKVSGENTWVIAEEQNSLTPIPLKK